MFSSEARPRPHRVDSAAVMVRGGFPAKGGGGGRGGVFGGVSCKRGGGGGRAVVRSYFWCRVCAGRWMAAIRHVVTPYLSPTAAPKLDQTRARKVKEWDLLAAASAPCPLDALLLCSRRRTSARFAIRAARGSRRRIGGLAEPLRAKQRLCFHAPREARGFNRCSMAVDARSAGASSIGLLEASRSKWFLAAWYGYGEYSAYLAHFHIWV